MTATNTLYFKHLSLSVPTDDGKPWYTMVFYGELHNATIVNH